MFRDLLVVGLKINLQNTHFKFWSYATAQYPNNIITLAVM